MLNITLHYSLLIGCPYYGVYLFTQVWYFIVLIPDICTLIYFKGLQIGFHVQLQ